MATEKREVTLRARSTNKATAAESIDPSAHLQRRHDPQLLIGNAESFAAGGESSPSPTAPARPRPDRQRRRARAHSCRNQQPHPAVKSRGHTVGQGLPGCWVMPSTAATASGTAAGPVTAASSKNQIPVGKFLAQPPCDFGCQAGLADHAHPGQRDQPMCSQRGLHLGDVGLAPTRTSSASVTAASSRASCAAIKPNWSAAVGPAEHIPTRGYIGVRTKSMNQPPPQQGPWNRSGAASAAGGYTACWAAARVGAPRATTVATARRIASEAVLPELRWGCVESAATVAAGPARVYCLQKMATGSSTSAHTVGLRWRGPDSRLGG